MKFRLPELLFACRKLARLWEGIEADFSSFLQDTTSANALVVQLFLAANFPFIHITNLYPDSSLYNALIICSCRGIGMNDASRITGQRILPRSAL